jgi:hypothetical protein
VSPKPRHIPPNARPTSISLTDEDHAAVNWIKTARKQRGNDRKTLNDILVDGLWYLLEHTEGKTREDIKATIPHIEPFLPQQDKITEMPKPKSGR